ncbi:hypothetical protein BN13_1570003 [Nostocoides jenkinsii Ben 74]|uniref:Uncharacterized protein n=1 Tax=Nostocoides jenkinsii Ben 74 TaxID=1193518 RepID=A0A077MC63_9MICO|nr:hypothetical protein BN13_1570003 [Tetrasphaera jenkinsii Ben 74]
MHAWIGERIRWRAPPIVQLLNSPMKV